MLAPRGAVDDLEVRRPVPEVVRESHQPLPETHCDNFDTKTYLMSEREANARPELLDLLI